MTQDEAIELVLERWGRPVDFGSGMAFWHHVRRVMADERYVEKLRPVRGLRQRSPDEPSRRPWAPGLELRPLDESS